MLAFIYCHDYYHYYITEHRYLFFISIKNCLLLVLRVLNYRSSDGVNFPTNLHEISTPFPNFSDIFSSLSTLDATCLILCATVPKMLTCINTVLTKVTQESSMKLQKGYRITKDTICRINVKCRIKSALTGGYTRLT